MCTCRLLADAPDVLGVTVTVGHVVSWHGISCLQSVSYLVPRVSVVSETLQKYVLPHLAAILCTSLAVPAATPKVQMMCTHTIKCIQLAHWMPSPSSRSYSRLCKHLQVASPEGTSATLFHFSLQYLHFIHSWQKPCVCVYILNTSPMSYVKLSYKNKRYVRLVLLQPVKKNRCSSLSLPTEIQTSFSMCVLMVW